MRDISITLETDKEIGNLEEEEIAIIFFYLYYLFEFLKKPIKYSNKHTYKTTNVNKQ